MWQDTTKRDCCANKSVQFFVTADGELQMARGDTLDLKVLGCVLFIVSASRYESRGTKLTPASSRTSAVKYSRTAVT